MRLIFEEFGVPASEELFVQVRNACLAVNNHKGALIEQSVRWNTILPPSLVLIHERKALAKFHLFPH